MPTPENTPSVPVVETLETNPVTPETSVDNPTTPETDAEREAKAAARVEAEARERTDAQKKAADALTGATETGEKPKTSNVAPTSGKKPLTERVTEGIGKGLKYAAETLGSLSVTIKNVFVRLPDEVRQFIYHIAKMLKIDFLVAMLEPEVKVSQVKKAMKASLGDGKVKDGPNDMTALARLQTQYLTKIRESADGKLTQENYTFEEFYQAKIDNLAKDRPNQPIYTMDDLVAYKTQAEQQEEVKRNEENIKALTAAGATEVNGVWTISIDLGGETMTDPAKPNATVQFRKRADGTWEWTNNSPDAVKIAEGASGRWLGGERFDEKDANGKLKLTMEQKERRMAMNALAEKLKVKDHAVAAPSGAAPEAKETLDQRKNRHITALINAFNEQAGTQTVVINPTNDSWRVKASDFIGKMRADGEYDDKLKLELDPDDLEATDSVGVGGWDVTHISDKDILDGWAKQIAEDPERAVKSFLALNPTELELDEKSTDAIRGIQTKLRLMNF